MCGVATYHVDDVGCVTYGGSMSLDGTRGGDVICLWSDCARAFGVDARMRALSLILAGHSM